MSEMYFRLYRRLGKAEMTEWHPDLDMSNVNVSDEDRAAGHPKEGDMIERNPENHKELWLVRKMDFRKYYEPV